MSDEMRKKGAVCLLLYFFKYTEYIQYILSWKNATFRENFTFSFTARTKRVHKYLLILPISPFSGFSRGDGNGEEWIWKGWIMVAKHVRRLSRKLVNCTRTPQRERERKEQKVQIDAFMRYGFRRVCRRSFDRANCARVKFHKTIARRVSNGYLFQRERGRKKFGFLYNIFFDIQFFSIDDSYFAEL